MNKLTTKDAAKLIGVSTSRVRQFVGQKRIKATKFGRDLEFTRAEVLRFIASRKVPPE